jgi:hypothetical protein
VCRIIVWTLYSLLYGVCSNLGWEKQLLCEFH